MNEAILRHLAKTEATLEVLLALHAKIYAPTLEMTDDQAEKHFQKTANDNAILIFNKLVKDLNK